MARVWILGSGFSASCGLPTLSALFPEILKAQPNGEDVRRVKEAIPFLYPKLRTLEGYDKYPPFEEFLGFVDMMEDFSLKKQKIGGFKSGDWEKVKTSSIRLLSECLIQKMEKVKTLEPIKMFVQEIKPADTVITFNWDTLLEWQLQEAGKEMVFGPSDGKGQLIQVLKLHGSLSWICAETKEKQKGWLDPGCEGNPRLFWTRSYTPRDLRDLLGEKKTPHIVTPGWLKRPMDEEILTNQWRAAWEQLDRVADDVKGEIFVVGYSLPKDDMHARAMFSLTLGAKDGGATVRIINPDPFVAKKFRDISKKRIRLCRRKFTRKVIEQVF